MKKFLLKREDVVNLPTLKKNNPKEYNRLVRIIGNEVISQSLSLIKREVDPTFAKRLTREAEHFMSMWKSDISLATIISKQIYQTQLEIRKIFNRCTSCLSCNNTCCRSRHSYLRDVDYRYIVALGRQDQLALATESRLSLSVSKNAYNEVTVSIASDDNCCFLGDKGCLLDGGCRPLTCVNHICDNIDKELRKFKKHAEMHRLRDRLSSLYDFLRDATRTKSMLAILESTANTIKTIEG